MQRFVVLRLISFATHDPNAAPERPSRARRRPDAANFDSTRLNISGQSTACLAHPRGRSDTTPSSPAAESVATEARHERRERSCRRSGAAPCCVAVDSFQPLEPKRRARATEPRPAKPRRRQISPQTGKYQRPEYCLPHAHQRRRSDTTTKLTRRRPITTNFEQSRKAAKRTKLAAVGCSALLCCG